MRFSIFLALTVLLVRLISLGMYPLMDTTEVRYGEMARMMVESGDWVTPMFDYGVPFWGKPPVFAWLSSSGFIALGESEFSARLPHFLVGLATLALIWTLVRRGRILPVTTNKIELNALACMTIAILANTASFIMLSGAVMTDAALMFSVALSMIGFWMSWQKQGKAWGYLFFVGLAWGMLSKGPIALVLVGISLTLWLAFQGRWKRLGSTLPWKGGLLLFSLIALPWYILAEIRSPGFLNYFLVGEHFKRFVVSGWQGDLYGTAHDRPRGMIWLDWLAATLPWTPLLAYQLFRIKNSPSENTHPDDQGGSFLWCWMLAPMLLFTLSGNILWTYVLPGIPAFALLLVYYHVKRPLPLKAYYVGFLMPLILLLTATALSMGLTKKSSDKDLLTEWKKQANYQSLPLTYIGSRPFSAQYYSQGRAQKTDLALSDYLVEEPMSYVVVRLEQFEPTLELPQFGCEERARSNKRILLFCDLH